MVFDPNDQTTSYSFNRLFEDGVRLSPGLAWSGESVGHAIVPRRPLDCFGVGYFGVAGRRADARRVLTGPMPETVKPTQGKRR